MLVQVKSIWRFKYALDLSFDKKRELFLVFDYGFMLVF